ncbi:hypothetical protein F8M41_000121 [Gigaspora margarita]|uniref:F-box domain-containing protein n=1 Tax=Gigaspora margarita TaxID=4874 RepID=A0A8H4B533_GIGMA|nr:hypothetical protein F8M41_000121 [Gigaspora margarita]
MASKIFMGDMPELMENILNNLNNEIYSLYSCALVNRHCCKMSIPILWQDPFSFKQNSLFISTYFSSLGEDEKLALKECGIDVKFSKKLFDYARFLKVLDLLLIKPKVMQWINFQHVHPEPSIQSIYRIVNLLIKLFIESGATLHKLIYFPNDEINPETFYVLEQNELFLSQLQDFSLEMELSFLSIEHAIKLLKILEKNAKKISALKFVKFDPKYELQLFSAFKFLIISQEQLRKFSLVIGKDFHARYQGMISALECQKNTLEEIMIENCGYSAEFEKLNNCKNLETLRIWHCDTKLLKILNCEISTLEIVNFELNSSTIIQILEKSGLLLQRLKLGSLCKMLEEESLLLESLKCFCPNIKYLNIMNIGFSTQFLELICNLQDLQFLTFAKKVESYVKLIPYERIVVNC